MNLVLGLVTLFKIPLLGVSLVLFSLLAASIIFSVNIGHDFVEELLGLRPGLFDGIAKLIIIFTTVDHLLDDGVPVVLVH